MGTLSWLLEFALNRLEWYLDALAPIVTAVWSATGPAALLGLLVLIFTASLRRWLTAGQSAALWGLVLVRFALPVTPTSPISAERLWLYGAEAAQHLASAPESVMADQNSDLVDRDDAQTATASTGQDSRPSSNPIAGSPQVESEPVWQILVVMIQLGILVAFPFVFVAIVLRTAVRHYRFCGRIRSTMLAADDRLANLWEQCCNDSNLSRMIPLSVVRDLSQPVAIGLWRPTVLIPSRCDELRDTEVRMLMLHELAHILRRDIAVNWGITLLRTVYWWNPVFWFAAARFRTCSEQACDAFAIRHAGSPEAPREYGELLLMFADRKLPRLPLSASFLGRASWMRTHSLKCRLRALKSGRIPQGRIRKTLASLLIAGLACAGWSSAAAPVLLDRGTVWKSLLIADGTQWTTAPVIEHGNPVRKKYGLSGLMDRWVTNDPMISREDAKRQIELLLKTCVQGRLQRTGINSGFLIDGEQIEIFGPESFVDDISQMLSVWEDSSPTQITIECRLITSDEDLADKIGVGWQWFGQSAIAPTQMAHRAGDREMSIGAVAATEYPLPICTAALPARAVKEFVNAAQSSRRTNVLFAPKLTVFNGVVGSIANLMSQPFVVGVDGDGRQTPKIQVYEEGTRLQIQPFATDGGSRIGLRGMIDYSDITSVRTATAKTQSGADVTIQIPRSMRVHINVDSELAPDESLLVGCLPSDERDEFLYFVLTPCVLENVDLFGTKRDASRLPQGDNKR
jgi:beta-lactamase regulating signal transducer with metallopeptidase domain